MRKPTIEDAKVCVSQVYSDYAIVDISRFTTGLCHYVYDVVLEHKTTRMRFPVVARLTTEDKAAMFRSFRVLHQKLREQCFFVLLPIIYHCSTSGERLPFIIMERLAGKDLGDVYNSLTPQQRRGIAEIIAKLQCTVSTILPHGLGYGWALVDEPAVQHLKSSWKEVLLSGFQESLEKIAAKGFFNPCLVTQVVELVESKLISEYLLAVPSVCFLDDTTTKNVIVDNGTLTGVVDIDCVCYGDPLCVLGLTHMAVLSIAGKTDYVDFWFDEYAKFYKWDQHTRAFKSDVLALYTLWHCIGFMAECGHVYNKDAGESADKVTIDRYTHIYESLYTLLCDKFANKIK